MVENSTSTETLILDSQAAWRSARRNPFTTVSQTIELPSFIVRPLYNAVLENLPDYLPEGLGESLRISHPEPVIGISAYRDPRLSMQLPSLIRYPAHLQTEQTRLKWLTGMWILNEFVVETANFDVVDKILKANLGKVIPQPLGNFYSWYLRSINQGISGYKPIFNKMAYLYGTQGSWGYDRVRNNLTSLAFTGNSQSLDETCIRWSDPKIENLEELALYLGKGAETINNRKRFQLRRKRMESNAICSHQFPGVINFQGRIGVEYFPFLFPHEILHYLSIDQNRIGLLPVNFKKNLEN